MEAVFLKAISPIFTIFAQTELMRLLRWILVVALLLAGAGRAVAQAAEDPVWVPGSIDSIWINGNEYCYTFDDGTNTQTVCNDYPGDANVVIIIDENGNEYIVSFYPEPGSVSGPYNYYVYLGGEGIDETMDGIDEPLNDTLSHLKIKIDTTRYYRNGETIQVSKLKSGYTDVTLYKILESHYFCKPRGKKRYYIDGGIKSLWLLNDRYVVNDTTFVFPRDSVGHFAIKTRVFKSFPVVIDSADIDFSKHPELEKTEFIYDTLYINDSITVNIDVVDNPLVQFYPELPYNGEYGFDQFEIHDFREFYTFKTISEVEYPVPYLMIKKNQSATIRANVLVPSLYSGFKIKFEVSDPTKFSITPPVEYDSTSLNEGNNNPIILRIKNEKSEMDKSIDSCWINVRDDKENLIGQLILLSKPTIKRNLTLIFVKSDTAAFSTINQGEIKDGLLSYLNNKSYNQTFIEWQNKPIQELNMIPYLSTLDTMKNDQKIFDYLKKQYKVSNTMAAGMHYVFIYDRVAVKKGLGGKGTFSETKNYAETNPLSVIIFYDNIKRYSTYAHECGHNLRLYDIVLQYPAIGYSTQNFMDYTISPKMFWLWQIKLLRSVKTNVKE